MYPHSIAIEPGNLFPPMLGVLFSFPTQLALFLSFSLPLSQVFKTQVCLTQVCLLDKCPSIPTTVGVTYKSLTRSIYIQAYLQVSRLCIAKPTAWKRGCGKVRSTPFPQGRKRGCEKVRSTPFPHYQKESVAVLAIVESFC